MFPQNLFHERWNVLKNCLCGMGKGLSGISNISQSSSQGDSKAEVFFITRTFLKPFSIRFWLKQILVSYQTFVPLLSFLPDFIFCATSGTDRGRGPKEFNAPAPFVMPGNALKIRHARVITVLPKMPTVPPSQVHWARLRLSFLANCGVSQKQGLRIIFYYNRPHRPDSWGYL